MITFPIFRSRPALLVGMPVSRANFCFIWVIPNALFKENDTPGIFIEIVFLITNIHNYHSSVHTIASINVCPFNSTGGSKPDFLVLLKQKLSI